jgi:hypothetical protein
MISAGTRSSGRMVRKSHNASGQSWTGVEIGRHTLESGLLLASKEGKFGGFHSLQKADPIFHHSVSFIWKIELQPLEA